MISFRAINTDGNAGDGDVALQEKREAEMFRLYNKALALHHASELETASQTYRECLVAFDEVQEQRGRSDKKRHSTLLFVDLQQSIDENTVETIDYIQELHDRLTSKQAAEKEDASDLPRAAAAGRRQIPTVDLLQYLCLKNLGAIYEQKGEQFKAMQFFLAALQVDDTDVVVWYHLGKASAAVQNMSAARWAFEQALQRDPSHWQSVHQLALVMHAVGEWEQSEALLATLLHRYPGHPLVLPLYQTLTGVSAPPAPVVEEPKRLVNSSWTMPPRKKRRPPPAAEVELPLLEDLTWLSLGSSLLKHVNSIKRKFKGKRRSYAPDSANKSREVDEYGVPVIPGEDEELLQGVEGHVGIPLSLAKLHTAVDEAEDADVVMVGEDSQPDLVLVQDGDTIMTEASMSMPAAEEREAPVPASPKKKTPRREPVKSKRLKEKREKDSPRPEAKIQLTDIALKYFSQPVEPPGPVNGSGPPGSAQTGAVFVPIPTAQHRQEEAVVAFVWERCFSELQANPGEVEAVVQLFMPGAKQQGNGGVLDLVHCFLQRLSEEVMACCVPWDNTLAVMVMQLAEYATARCLTVGSLDVWLAEVALASYHDKAKSYWPYSVPRLQEIAATFLDRALWASDDSSLGESSLTPSLYLRLCWCKGSFEFATGDMALAETYILQVKEMLTTAQWRDQDCPAELPLPHTYSVLREALLEDKLGVLYHKALIQSSKALFSNKQYAEVVEQLAPIFLRSTNAETNISGFAPETRKVLYEMLAESLYFVEQDEEAITCQVRLFFTLCNQDQRRGRGRSKKEKRPLPELETVLLRLLALMERAAPRLPQWPGALHELERLAQDLIPMLPSSTSPSSSTSKAGASFYISSWLYLLEVVKARRALESSSAVGTAERAFLQDAHEQLHFQGICCSGEGRFMSKTLDTFLTFLKEKPQDEDDSGAEETAEDFLAQLLYCIYDVQLLPSFPYASTQRSVGEADLLLRDKASLAKLFWAVSHFHAAQNKKQTRKALKIVCEVFSSLPEHRASSSLPCGRLCARGTYHTLFQGKPITSFEKSSPLCTPDQLQRTTETSLSGISSREIFPLFKRC